MDYLLIIIYILKLINYGFLVASLYISGRLFSEIYMKKVYAEDEHPPNILQFLGLCLILHAGLNLFLIIVLLLLMAIFKTNNNVFAINMYVISRYFFDFVLSVLFFSICSIIIGSIIQKKKYFRYKTEGLRAIRAYKEILMYCAIIIFLLPYFIYF